MTNPTPDAPRHRLILFSLALGLVAILLTSLWQRFSNPSLTVSRFANARQIEPTSGGSMENMAAIGQLMETVAQNPHDLQALLRLTESLIAVGQWDSAENFALKAMSEPGENTRAMYLLAIVNHNQGKHGEAAELLEKLLQKEENPSARYSLAILDIHFLNKPEAGRQQLQQGLLVPGAPAGLRTAMQEELAKLPPAPNDSSELGNDDKHPGPDQPTPSREDSAQEGADSTRAIPGGAVGEESGNGKTEER